MTWIVSGRRVPGSVPALNASNVAGAQALTMASAICDRALLWVQTNSTRFFVMARTIRGVDQACVNGSR